MTTTPTALPPIYRVCPEVEAGERGFVASSDPDAWWAGLSLKRRQQIQRWVSRPTGIAAENTQEEGDVAAGQRDVSEGRP